MSGGADPSTKMQAASQSSSSAGFSNTAQPAKPATDCKYATPKKGKRCFQNCDIATMTLHLKQGEKSYTVPIPKRQRQLPVAKTVAPAYKSLVTRVDVVVEALSDTNDNHADVHEKEKHSPLELDLSATMSARHSCTTPAHPHLAFTGAGDPVAKDGGAPIKTEAWAPNPSIVGGSIFGHFWPFGGPKPRVVFATGESCGVAAKNPNIDLAAAIVVMSGEEWTISIGLLKGKGASFEKSRKMAEGPDDKMQAATVTTVQKTGGGLTSNTTNSTFKNDDFSEKTTVSEASTRLISPNATLSDSDSTFGSKDSKETRPSQVDRLKIKHKTGGQEYELDASEFMNDLLKAESIIDYLKDLLGSAKIGWSISWSYTMLEGDLQVGWGRRWPKAYTEEDRVYYVERYASIGGSLKLIDGKIEGMAGLEVSWPGLYMVAKVYLSLAAELSVGAKGDFCYTNELKSGAFHPKLTVDGKVTPELGAKAGGRALGYSIEARLVLQGQITLEGEGSFSFHEPPEFTASMKSDPIMLVGDVMTSGRTPKRLCGFHPLQVLDGKTFFEKKPIL